MLTPFINFLVYLELIFYQFKISSVPVGKLVMSPLFNYFPLIQYDNVICIFNCTESMGDNNDRSISEKFLHAVHNGAFIIGVQGVCRFIKEKKLGILIYSPCNENTLTLPLADSIAFRSYPG